MSADIESEFALQTAFGQDFLDLFVEYASHEMRAEMVTVGAFRLFETERVQVVASSLRDNNRSAFEYETQGAPCHDVVSTGNPLVVMRDVQTDYPRDGFFRTYGFQSYVGLPLRNSVGEIIGLVQVSWKRPVCEWECEKALALFAAFAARLGGELETRAKLAALEALVAEADMNDNKNRFPRLAARLQEALALKTVFIAECIESQPNHFRILGYCLAGAAQPEAEGLVVPYAGSPCDGLRCQRKVIIETGLQELFPEQSSFVELGLNAYLGVALFDVNGKVIGHIAMQNDRNMSERLGESELVKILARRVEVELRRHRADALRRDAEAAFLVKQKNESLGLLAGSLSHDFNNLLASMVGHAELALDGLDDGHPVRKNIEVIGACLEASTSLVKRLQDYSNFAPTGELSLVNLKDLVGDVMTLLPAKLSDYELRLECSDQELLVVADPTQISQLLMNLVINAMEAVDAGAGQIMIRMYRKHLSNVERSRLILDAKQLGDDCVVLEVSDTGPGMSRETSAKVFDPYFTTKKEGKGLGLAAVLGIARRHGAAIAMETHLGQGTAFAIMFPPAKRLSSDDDLDHGPDCSDTAAALGGNPSAQRDAAQKILVVDDEPVLGKLLETSLENAGYSPFVATGHEAALGLMQKHGPFECALVDITMPGKNGWETIVDLRLHQPDLRAIMMSGFSISSTDAGYPELEQMPFLNKPFRPSMLLSVLQDVLQGGLEEDASDRGLPTARG